MAAMLPASVYGLRVPAGGLPLMATVIPGTIRITMAAIDPSADPIIEGDVKTPRATLKLIRATPSFEDDSDEDDLDDLDDIEAIKARLAGVISDDDSDISEDDDSEEEKNGGPSDPVKAKQAKREAFQKKLQAELDAEAMEVDSLPNGVNGAKSKGKAKVSDDDEISSEEDESEDEGEEFVVCTLDPEKHYQQPLDITIGEDEEVAFVVNGTHDVFLTGNYVLPPYDEDDYEEGDSEDEHAHNMLDYDMSPDEDELDDEVSDSEEDALDGLADPRITEVDSDDDEAPKLVEKGKKGKNKRPAEADTDSEGEAITLDELISKTIKPETVTTNGEKLSKKQAKKLKKNDGQAAPAASESKAEAAKKEAANGDKKKVQFSKNLEMGPTGSPKVEEKKEVAATKSETPAKTGPRSVGGVQVEDKKTGKGPAAKKGSKVEMRYIGKLKNGKVFDSNKKGKPFSFKLGVGEVIKGWDVGVAGMSAGGERRLTIPAKLAYGNKALPDIPANSDLVFDIKCLSVN